MSPRQWRSEGEVGGACRGSSPTGACRVLDLDFDDDVDDDDLDLFDDLPDGLARHPGRIASGVGQPFGHQGLLFEPEIGSYQNRARQYDGKGRFMQRDALPRMRYVGDSSQVDWNLYAYEAANPISHVDWSGWAPAGCHSTLCFSNCYPPNPQSLTPAILCDEDSHGNRVTTTCTYRCWAVWYCPCMSTCTCTGLWTCVNTAFGGYHWT
ncbi:MAG: hypothetical protein JSU63_07900 [Phycisphaerales bacterium]|nr:MAG: hypothetical protein JSU63_07900 [Phycisphaerales bacterium]